jgi:excisionase family DNA binding protein
MNTDERKKLDRIMRLPEIALVLGKCRRSVRRMVDHGELPPFVRSGRNVGLMESDIEAYLKRICEERGSVPQRSEI